MVEVIAVLILFMIAGAIIAVETSRLLSSVISVGAVGFLLAIAFLRLCAILFPSITQATHFRGGNMFATVDSNGVVIVTVLG